MTQIKLTVSDELTPFLREVSGPLAMREINQAVRETALAVLTSAVKSMAREQKTGKIYKRGNIRHQSSAPGEAPSVDTGRLIGSINAEMNHVSANKGRVRRGSITIGTNVAYGRYLEFGTRHIKERPWLRPALQRNAPFFSQRLAAALARIEKL